MSQSVRTALQLVTWTGGHRWPVHSWGHGAGCKGRLTFETRACLQGSSRHRRQQQPPPSGRDAVLPPWAEAALGSICWAFH